MEIRVPLSQVYYRGCKAKYAKFSEYRPVFFSKSAEYATAYGPILVKAHLDVKRFFDTRYDKNAVRIFNEYFLKSGLAHDKASPIVLGTPVTANDADELWSYLSVPEYPGVRYDGIIVFEGDVGAYYADANMSYVPLHVSQIKVL